MEVFQSLFLNELNVDLVTVAIQIPVKFQIFRKFITITIAEAKLKGLHATGKPANIGNLIAKEHANLVTAT